MKSRVSWSQSTRSGTSWSQSVWSGSLGSWLPSCWLDRHHQHLQLDSWTVLLTPSSRSVVFAQTDPLVYKLHLCPEFSVLWSISRLHGSMMLLLLLPSLAFGQVCSYDSFSQRTKLSRSANCAINCLKHVAGLRFWVSWRKWVLRRRTPVWSLLWVWRRSGGLHLIFIIRFEVVVAAFNTNINPNNRSLNTSALTDLSLTKL